MSMESQKDILESGMVKEADRTEAITASATLEVYEQLAICDSTDGAMTLTLPPVGEAKGKFYSIIFETDNGDLTVADQDDSYDWDDLTMTAAVDGALLFSDGMKWWVVVNDIGS